MFPRAFAAGSLYRITDEALLAETTWYDQSSFLWVFSLLFKELVFYFYLPIVEIQMFILMSILLPKEMSL